MARLNLTIPDPLYERMERLRDRVNVSKVCAVALAKELDMLEGSVAGGAAAATSAGAEAKVQRMVQRFLRQREAQERWYQRGRHDGEQWAVERASLEELKNVAEEWDEETVVHAPAFHVLVHEHQYPTLNARELLQQWQADDRAETGPEAAAAFAEEWRAYMEGWRIAARDLWQQAKSSLP